MLREYASTHAPGTTRNLRSDLSMFLGYFHRKGELREKPVRLSDTYTRPDREMLRWTVEEGDQFLALDEVRQHRYGIIYLVLAETGLRIGELCGLRPVDVDLDRPVLHVRQTVIRDQLHGGLAIGKPKTERGSRDVHLDADLAAQLAWYAARRDRALAGEARFFFCGPDGGPLNPRVIAAAFSRLVERVGLPKVRLHSLRSWHLSNLAAAGVPNTVLARRAGHSSIEVTNKFYLDVDADQDRSAAEAAAARRSWAKPTARPRPISDPLTSDDATRAVGDERP